MRVYLREAPQKFCLQIDGTSDLCTALDSCALGVATGAVHGIVVPFYAVLHSFTINGLYFRLKFSDIRGICEGKINGPFRNVYLERMVGLLFFFLKGGGEGAPVQGAQSSQEIDKHSEKRKRLCNPTRKTMV